jgi:SAM-dependent methyltransferase
VKEALDIGCGTGAWAIEFADHHPNTNILGIDLSPIQPSTVPINCTFEIDDATKDWNFIKKFDFIHTRAITMGIGNWDRLVEQAYNFLNPGAWLELQEFHLPLGCEDGSMNGTSLEKWGQEVHRATAKVGINSLASLEHLKRMTDRGFIDLKEKELKIPLGPWAKGKQEKKIGTMAQKDLYDGMEGISTKLFLLLGYSKEEVTELLDKARVDLMNPEVSCSVCQMSMRR